MKTKRTLLSLVALMMLLSFNPIAVKASGENPPSPKVENTQKIAELEMRLNEINAMDKTDMSNAEKRALRKEVKTIKRTIDNGGIYISVGGLIIILLLLIILL